MTQEDEKENEDREDLPELKPAWIYFSGINIPKDDLEEEPAGA